MKIKQHIGSLLSGTSLLIMWIASNSLNAVSYAIILLCFIGLYAGLKLTEG